VKRVIATAEGFLAGLLFGVVLGAAAGGVCVVLR
jgi:hypothetical protein